jgi:hypothetical protein
VPTEKKNLKQREHSEDLALDGRLILTLILRRERTGRCRQDLFAQNRKVSLFIGTVTAQRFNEITFVSSNSTYYMFRLFMKPSSSKYIAIAIELQAIFAIQC